MTKKPQSLAYQVGKNDGDIQGYLIYPKSDSDCFIASRPRLQESDRADYMEGFAVGFNATMKLRGL